MLGWSRSPASIGLLCGCGATSPQLMRMGWGRAETSAAVIPSPALTGAWSGVRATRGVNHNGDRAEIGGSDNLPAARVLRPRCSRRHLPVGQGADVSVAQPVVDEGEQLAGRDDLGDIAAASGLDAFAIARDLGGVGLAPGWPRRPPIARVCCPAW
jgi:hypothetical protein